jgi:LmbE family N-acetylglucosaminyl deacetylase
MPARTALRRSVLLALVAAFGGVAACSSPSPQRVRVSAAWSAGSGPRILAVNAHPDDETAFAATLYKASTYLGATCDVVVLTNGEGGFKYATLAERMYGQALTDEAVGRRLLPGIRRAEMLAGAELLELRDVHFLGQRDHRYTPDVGEVLGRSDGSDGAGPGVWDLAYVRGYLRALMEAERYDFVFTLAPTATTHGHHQAASLLAVEVAGELPAERRPVCLAVDVAAAPDDPRPVVNDRASAALERGPPLLFDRAQRFGHRDALSYSIVVNLVIAAHRSQGTMQLAMNGGPLERFYLYARNPPDARVRAAALFDALKGGQFRPREYAESAGTNAAAR